MNFKEIKPEELNFQPFYEIGKNWMLITAGDKNGYNTMTASWGAVGIMWGKYAATCYIRPQRYTKKFVDSNEIFTLSFFPDGTCREALNVCGRISGKDQPNKAEANGLHPLYIDGTTAFEEAKVILVCKKMYEDTIKPERFIDATVDSTWYPQKDYHTMYIAEIQKVLVRV